MNMWSSQAQKSVTIKYLMAEKKLRLQCKGQLYNHKSNSKIYYEHCNNYGFIYLLTSTKYNLNSIQTSHSIYCTTQPSASYDLIFLSFLKHYNYVF